MGGKKGRYIVLDGRQRLLALMQFCKFADESPLNGFALNELEVVERASGKVWADLEGLDLLTQFENATVRSVVVRNWKTERLLHLLFTRLNTETTKLNAQELRLAAYPGEFVYFVDDQSVVSPGLARLFSRDAGECDPRMADTELLVRYFAFRNCFERYLGPMRPFLDYACVSLNSHWQLNESVIHGQMESFEHAVTLGYSFFGEGFGKRWDNDAKCYRGRVNRAILDVLLFYLSSVSAEQENACKTAFRVTLETLFERDDAFLDSIESTARHTKKSVTRFSIFGAALVDAGIEVEIPDHPLFD